MVSTTVEQLGFVTIAPLPARPFACTASRPRWSGLTSGTSSGTAGSMRWFRELLTTRWPASANACSISPATLASSAEKTRLRAAAGRAGLDAALRDAWRDGGVEPPGRGVGVALALRALAGGQPDEREPRVTGQLIDELLADHAGRAEHPDLDPLLHVLAPGASGPSNDETRRRRVPRGGFGWSYDLCAVSSRGTGPHRRRGDSCAFEWPAFER